MDGRTTNRRAWGVVQATNVSVSFKDKETGLYTPLYKGLTQTDYECQEGDSGDACMKEGAIPPLPIINI